MECAAGAVEGRPDARGLALEVDRVLVAPGAGGARGAQGHRAAEPRGERGVVARGGAVGQYDLDAAVVAKVRRREQQLGNAPRREPEAGFDVEQREASVTVDALRRDLGRVETFTLERFDRIAPQLEDLHRADHTTVPAARQDVDEEGRQRNSCRYAGARGGR